MKKSILLLCLFLSTYSYSQTKTYQSTLHNAEGETNSSGQPIGIWKYTGTYYSTSGEIFNYDTYELKVTSLKDNDTSDKHAIILQSGKLDTNFKRTGAWKEFYEDGSLKATGSYENDNPIGTWKGFHPDSSIRSMHYWNNGNRVGNWIDYFEDGSLEESTNYRDNKRNGPSTRMEDHRDFKLRIVGNFTDNNRDGEFTTYLVHPRGEFLTEKVTYKNGRITGDKLQYNEKGEVTSTTSYNENGNTIETKEFFEEGTVKKRSKPLGEGGNWEHTLYYPNENFKLKYIEKESSLYNIIALKDINGNTLDYGTFKDGNGTVKGYTNEGVLEKITTYKNSIPSGLYTELGEIKIDEETYAYKTTGQIESGVKTGEYKTTIEKDGNLFTINSAHYFQNIAIEDKTYYLDGSLKSTLTIDKNTGKKEVSNYYKSGQIKITLQFQYPNSLLNILECKSPSGENLDYGTIKDGTGTFKEYNDNGELETTYTFKDSQVISKE